MRNEQNFATKDSLSVLSAIEPPMNWLCRLGIHRWSLYTEILERTKQVILGVPNIERFQRRMCVNCRKGQENIINE